MRGVSDSRVGMNTKNWTFNAFCLPFEELKSHFLFFVTIMHFYTAQSKIANVNYDL